MEDKPYSILETKLFIPPLHSNVILRPRLLKRLSRGSRGKLTLLSAPPGFGKTTLLTNWVHQNKVRACWYSLDAGDNDPARFLRYLIVSFQDPFPGIGDSALEFLKSPSRPGFESILVHLLNDLTSQSVDFSLILDDYHVIESKAIHHMMNFLLDHLPPQMHIIISTRSDPPLPLARLRSQDQLTEFRTVDLCFNSEEVELFFNFKLNLGLGPEDMARLEDRTEGWIAGLQLAALSLQNRKDPSSFIKDFGGSDRYIAEYLIEEVLNRQSEETRNFLLQTSILDPICAPLCDAVTGREGSQEILHALEKANLFILPLDRDGYLYRYHRLFGDILRHRLGQTGTGPLSELHRRAARWLTAEGHKEEAVDHLLLAGDLEEAANHIEEIAEVDWDRGMQSKLLGWFKKLPLELIASRPKLCIFFARELFENAERQEAEKWLDRAEDLLAGITLSSGEKDKFRGRIAVIRGVISAYRGFIPLIIQYAREALDLLPQEETMWRSVAACTLGFAYGWSGEGDLKKAHEAFSEAWKISEKAGNTLFSLLTGSCLAGVLSLQGRLIESKAMYEALLNTARTKHFLGTAPVASIYSSLGSLLVEEGDLAKGSELIDKGLELAVRCLDPVITANARFHKFRILFFQQDLKGAQEVIREIEKSEKEFPLPPWMSHVLSSMKAKLLLASGDLEACSRWIKERNLDSGDPITQRREPEYHVMVEILIAQERLEEAEILTERLLESAATGSRGLAIIQLRVLRSLIHKAKGETEPALRELGLAMRSAEQSGFLLTISLGRSVNDLLELALERSKKKAGHVPEFPVSYIKQLLVEFKKIKPGKLRPLPVPLSERELEVLHFIAAGFSNQDISEKLFISLNTVRTHTKNIHLKLDVHSRTRAVARAKEMGIL